MSYHKVIGRLQDSVKSIAGEKDSDVMARVKNIVSRHQQLCELSKVLDVFLCKKTDNFVTSFLIFEVNLTLLGAMRSHCPQL